jgi:TatD DNase family protein
MVREASQTVNGITDTEVRNQNGRCDHRRSHSRMAVKIHHRWRSLMNGPHERTHLPHSRAMTDQSRLPAQSACYRPEPQYVVGGDCAQHLSGAPRRLGWGKDLHDFDPRLLSARPERREAVTMPRRAPPSRSDPHCHRVMFDSHCHLSFPEFRGRVDEVMRTARDSGVFGAVTISTSSADAERSVAVARAHPDVWCSAGIHPLHCDEPIDWPLLRRCGEDPRCVAWGELGLDNHYPQPPRDLQRRVLGEQLSYLSQWAREGLSKPIVIHCREAFDDLLPILAASGFPHDRFVFHCFTGTAEEARRVLDFGAWISFTGVVTFRNAREVAAAAALTPADRIMVETDAPFLSPDPVRTVRPNVPAHIPHIVRRIAELRGEPAESFGETLDRNTERFFGIRIRRTVGDIHA